MVLSKRIARLSVLSLGVVIAACSAPVGEGEEQELSGSSESGLGGVRCDRCSVAPHVQAFASALCAETGSCDSGSYNGHQPNASLAIDNFVPVGGALGDRVAAWALANKGRFGAEYVIWKQRINFGNGWRWMEDRGSITQNHYDHVHISFFPTGGTGGGGGGGGGSCSVQGDKKLHCTNDDNIPMRKNPWAASPIVNHLRTTSSWFDCWFPGEPHAGGNNVWYWTQGDDNANFGFVPAADVHTTKDPAPGLIKCGD